MYHSIITLVFVLLSSVLNNILKAQNAYSFSRGQQAWNGLENAIDITHRFNADGLFAVTDLSGETFKMYDSTFTVNDSTPQFLIGKNAFLFLTNHHYGVLMDIAFTRLDSAWPDYRIAYRLDGSPGNYILKVEYRSMHLKNGQAGNYANFQLWLHQKSGVIEYYYGGHSASNSAGFSSSNGPNVGISIVNPAFTAVYDKLWVYGAANKCYLDSNRNLNFSAMLGLPDSSTFFRFTPRFKTLNMAQVKSPDFHADIYPNPTTDYFTVHAEAAQYMQIEIYNSLGFLIDRKTFEGNRIQYSAGHLSEGIYSIRVVTNNGIAYSRIHVLK